jgi:hypothetical protein
MSRESETVQNLGCSPTDDVANVQRMRAVWRVTSFAVHLLLIAAALATAVLVTVHVDYRPLRVALVVMVAVLCAVTVLGRFSLGLGPMAGSVTAGIVRMIGIVLAGIGAAEVMLDLIQGGSPSQRAFSGVPLATIVLAVYLAAFLSVTRCEGGPSPQAMLTGVSLGLLAAALFAGAVPVLPPGLIRLLGLILIVAATVQAGQLYRPAEIGVTAALLALVTACQAVFFAAVVLYHYGPDAWMPYAGPGPLTVQGQLEQNRAESIDPYVGLLLLGAVAATILTIQAVTAWLRARNSAEATAATAG